MALMNLPQDQLRDLLCESGGEKSRKNGRKKE
jgi:hypothetical protein